MPKTAEERVAKDVKQLRITRQREKLEEEYRKHVRTAAMDQDANERKHAREQAIGLLKQLDKLRRG
ncbi:MAG TPA: hypothetical protein VMY42_20485, partial [Thermoguttaceae bacterium]|nr:hypothetical protein [Thermoguttaceae bacterium]